MGDVDHRLKLYSLQGVCKNLLDALHHKPAVAQGEVDAEEHFLPVHLKLLASPGQERQTDVGRYRGMPYFVKMSCNLVVVVTDLLAEVARAGVDHDPEAAFLVLLQLDEVVAASKRAHLMQDGLATALHDFQLVYVIALWQVSRVLSILVVVHAERYTLADVTHNLLAEHISRDVFHLPAGLDCTHAAADVHAHGVGNDGILAGQHTTDRHPHAGMHVGHDGQVMEKEGQCRQVLNLAHGRLLDVTRPYLDGTVVDHLYFHCLFFL